LAVLDAQYRAMVIMTAMIMAIIVVGSMFESFFD
jgi:hypothetical protein